jgi:hypothetical protein
MKRPKIFILLGTAFIMLSWLFVGLYRDNEFYEPGLFTKYRPTFKVNFQSPIGMQDLQLNDLPPDSKIEEVAFQEFVIKQHIQNNSNARLWYLPFILIQLTLTFFSFGIITTRRSLVLKKWQLPAHFAICLIITSPGLEFILSFDNPFSTIIGGLTIMIVNYGTVVLLTRRQNSSEQKKSYA